MVFIYLKIYCYNIIVLEFFNAIITIRLLCLVLVFNLFNEELQIMHLKNYNK